MALRKQLPCGKEMSYKLVAGPAGFARAQVGTEFEETEVANLLLTVKKMPAGAKKKPAAADASDDKSELSDPPVEELLPCSRGRLACTSHGAQELSASAALAAESAAQLGNQCKTFMTHMLCLPMQLELHQWQSTCVLHVF